MKKRSQVQSQPARLRQHWINNYITVRQIPRSGDFFILLMSSCGLTTGPRYIYVPCTHKKEQKLCHSRAGGNRDQAVRVKRAKKSVSVGIIKIIPPLTLTTHTKKIFKDPIPAYAGMTRGGGFYSSYVILWLDHRIQVYMCALRAHKGKMTWVTQSSCGMTRGGKWWNNLCYVHANTTHLSKIFLMKRIIIFNKIQTELTGMSVRALEKPNRFGANAS